MLLKFKQAVHLNGKSYERNSVHPVSDELNDHPFFHKMIAAGLIVETEAHQVISAESLLERQKRLAETLLSKKPASPVKAEGAGDELPPAPEKSEEHGGEEAAGEEEHAEETEGSESESESSATAGKKKKKKH